MKKYFIDTQSEDNIIGNGIYHIILKRKILFFSIYLKEIGCYNEDNPIAKYELLKKAKRLCYILNSKPQ